MLQKREWWFCFYSRVPAALLQPKDSFPSSLGFSDCPLPCTLYNICSRVCSFALSSHGIGHNGFLVPLVPLGPTGILHFLYQTSQCPSRSQHKQCALAALPHCPLSSSWGDSSAGGPAPEAGWRMAECKRSGKGRLREAAAFSPP